MQDYTPNSHRFKEGKAEVPAEKKVEKVVTGVAKTKKKSEVSKFADVFISEDAHNVKSYIMNDIIVPTVKKAIMGALDMILNGGSTGYSDRRPTVSKVSYARCYDDPRDSNRAVSVSNSRFDYDDIMFTTRGDAERVLREMDAVIDEYKIITVADMYDMAGLSCPYTSQRYGWTNIRNAEVVRVRDGNDYGYVIKMPKAMPID